MENTWTTLYDVSREGIGIMPWFFTGMWLIGICATAMAIRKAPIGRLFLSFWLVGWCTLGGIGVGNVLYQYGANIHALKSGSCGIAEGPILHFHRQILFRKGDSEHFVVNGHRFSYFAAYLGSGLRSSAGFSIPLREGLYARFGTAKAPFADLTLCRKNRASASCRSCSHSDDAKGNSSVSR